MLVLIYLPCKDGKLSWLRRKRGRRSKYSNPSTAGNQTGDLMVRRQRSYQLRQSCLPIFHMKLWENHLVWFSIFCCFKIMTFRLTISGWRLWKVSPERVFLTFSIERFYFTYQPPCCHIFYKGILIIFLWDTNMSTNPIVFCLFMYKGRIRKSNEVSRFFICFYVRFRM